MFADLADLSIDESQHSAVQESKTNPRNNGLMKGFPLPPRQPRDITSDFAKASLGQSSSSPNSTDFTFSLRDSFIHRFKEGLQDLVIYSTALQCLDIRTMLITVSSPARSIDQR